MYIYRVGVEDEETIQPGLQVPGVVSKDFYCNQICHVLS